MKWLTHFLLPNRSAAFLRPERQQQAGASSKCIKPVNATSCNSAREKAQDEKTKKNKTFSFHIDDMAETKRQ